MVGVLADSTLYSFTGGTAPDLEALQERYRAQIAGPPRDGETWHNWVIRQNDAGGAVGFVQATVIDDSADVAWTIGPAWQRRGYAREAAAAMSDWLLSNGVRRLTAHIHPEHTASMGVATAIGLAATDETDDDGEVIWASGG